MVRILREDSEKLEIKIPKPTEVFKDNIKLQSRYSFLLSDEDAWFEWESIFKELIEKFNNDNTGFKIKSGYKDGSDTFVLDTKGKDTDSNTLSNFKKFFTEYKVELKGFLEDFDRYYDKKTLASIDNRRNK